jgi:peptidoglycan hydrolase-like protein with peptidoglycan-binding domain
MKKFIIAGLFAIFAFTGVANAADQTPVISSASITTSGTESLKLSVEGNFGTDQYSATVDGVKLEPWYGVGSSYGRKNFNGAAFLYFIVPYKSIVGPSAKLIVSNNSGSSDIYDIGSIPVEALKSFSDSPVSAFITVNGSHDVTLNVGDKIEYNWGYNIKDSRIKSSSVVSTLYLPGDNYSVTSCMSNTVGGSGFYKGPAVQTINIPTCQAGKTYSVKYEVMWTDSLTGEKKSNIDKVTIKINNVSSTPVPSPVNTTNAQSVITAVQGYNQNATEVKNAYMDGKALKDTYLIVYGTFDTKNPSVTVDGKPVVVVFSGVNASSKPQINISLSGLNEGSHVVSVNSEGKTGTATFTIATPVTATAVVAVASGVAPDAGVAKAISANLTVGSKGDDVLALQNFLISKGFLYTKTGKGTGLFGNGTLTALKAFQKANGLEDTGTVGPKTRDLVNGTATAFNVVGAGSGVSSDPGSAGALANALPVYTNVPDYSEINYTLGVSNDVQVYKQFADAYNSWFSPLTSDLRDTMQIQRAQQLFDQITQKMWATQGVSLENITANYAGAFNSIVRVFNDVRFLQQSSKDDQWKWTQKTYLQQVENWKIKWVAEIQKQLHEMVVTADSAGNRTASTVLWGKVVVDSKGNVVSAESSLYGSVPPSVVDEIMSRQLTPDAGKGAVAGAPIISGLQGWWNNAGSPFVASNTTLVVYGSFGANATVVVKDSTGTKEYSPTVIPASGSVTYDQVNINLGDLFGNKLDVFVKNPKGISDTKSIDIGVLQAGVVIKLPYPGDQLPLGGAVGTLVKPTISSLDVSTAKAGDTVKVSGSNFASPMNVSILPTISGSLISQFTANVISPTSLSFVVPSLSSNVGTGAHTIQVVDLKSGQISNSLTFSILPSTGTTPPASNVQPVIKSLQGFNSTTGSYSNGSAVAGGTLVIYGTFPSAGSSVTVDGVSQSVVTQSSNQINVTLGTATGLLGVKVFNGTLPSNELKIQVNAPLVTNTTPATSKPVITGVQGYDSTKNVYTTGSVVSGQSLVIYGSFDVSGNGVSINGMPVSTSYQSTTQLNIPIISAPVGTLNISVNNTKGTSNIFPVSVTATSAGSTPPPSTAGLEIFVPKSTSTTCTGTAPVCNSSPNTCGKTTTGRQVCSNGVWTGCDAPQLPDTTCTAAVCGSYPTPLCTSGTASSANLDTVAKQYIWTCGNGTTSGLVNCSSAYTGPVNGVCGIARNLEAPYVPTANFCYSGTMSGLTKNADTSYKWSCDGSAGTVPATCQTIPPDTTCNIVSTSVSGLTISWVTRNCDNVSWSGPSGYIPNIYVDDANRTTYISWPTTSSMTVQQVGTYRITAIGAPYMGHTGTVQKDVIVGSTSKVNTSTQLGNVISTFKNIFKGILTK